MALDKKPLMRDARISGKVCIEQDVKVSDVRSEGPRILSIRGKLCAIGRNLQ